MANSHIRYSLDFFWLKIRQLIIDGKALLFSSRTGFTYNDNILSGSYPDYGIDQLHSSVLLIETVCVHFKKEITGEHNWSIRLDAGRI